MVTLTTRQNGIASKRGPNPVLPHTAKYNSENPQCMPSSLPHIKISLGLGTFSRLVSFLTDPEYCLTVHSGAGLLR
ncbi:hypothetical protein E2C01_006349 [Portunus trituberculatus]|uniref:Uncharacterized protein n=1 Tax=Portunus trituberculatus TaxID=210409 RepID=A0A5B7CW33_PORTR|nr:hypothetical protein [Portunus trituberculatus]